MQKIHRLVVLGSEGGLYVYMQPPHRFPCIIRNNEPRLNARIFSTTWNLVSGGGPVARRDPNAKYLIEVSKCIPTLASNDVVNVAYFALVDARNAYFLLRQKTLEYI